MTDRFTIQK